MDVSILDLPDELLVHVFRFVYRTQLAMNDCVPIGQSRIKNYLDERLGSWISQINYNVVDDQAMIYQHQQQKPILTNGISGVCRRFNEIIEASPEIHVNPSMANICRKVICGQCTSISNHHYNYSHILTKRCYTVYRMDRSYVVCHIQRNTQTKHRFNNVFLLDVRISDSCGFFLFSNGLTIIDNNTGKIILTRRELFLTKILCIPDTISDQNKICLFSSTNQICIYVCDCIQREYSLRKIYIINHCIGYRVTPTQSNNVWYLVSTSQGIRARMMNMNNLTICEIYLEQTVPSLQYQHIIHTRYLRSIPESDYESGYIYESLPINYLQTYQKMCRYINYEYIGWGKSNIPPQIKDTNLSDVGINLISVDNTNIIVIIQWNLVYPIDKKVELSGRLKAYTF